MAAEEDSSGSSSWEGFSDYSRVSNQISSAVDEAVSAASSVQGIHDQGGSLRDEAGWAHGRILNAAVRLFQEMQTMREMGYDEDDKFSDILERWVGDPDVDRLDEADEGYIAELSQFNLHEQYPPWLLQFCVDIREAAWHLGYLQAGRYREEEDEEFTKQDVKEMFN